MVGIHGLFLLDWFTDPENNLSALGSRERMDKSGLHACGELSGGRRVLILHLIGDHFICCIQCGALPCLPCLMSLSMESL